MNWDEYKSVYIKAAKKENISSETIDRNLQYALNLFKSNLPIIYDVSHLSLLVGISEEYIYKITNSQKSGYRKFVIPKKSEGQRTINEPLPNLKIIQKWILENILENIEISVFAKAYRKNITLKDNVRFHKGQKIVLKLDVENFFSNLKQGKIISFFINLGYSLELSVVLAKLCTLNGSLPQGAPTSPALSNILMRDFDNKTAEYCKKNKVRYTRYADDLTFSGDFEVKSLYQQVKKNLNEINLRINTQKTKLMKQNNRQFVTGIVVNENLKVMKEYRKKIRQEIYFIEKFGINSHLEKINHSIDVSYYLKSLKGRIEYCIFIDPSDYKMRKFLSTVKELLNDK